MHYKITLYKCFVVSWCCCIRK